MRKLLAAVAFFGAIFAADGSAACDFDKAKQDGFSLLAAAKPRVSGRAKYVQILHLPNGLQVPLKKETDYREREIPVAVLNLADCSVSVLITEWRTENNRLELLGPPGIELEPRDFGPIRNGLNTRFEVGDGRVVVAEKWKVFGRDEYVLNVPYSAELHRAFPDLVWRGREHLRRDVEAALAYGSERKLIPNGLVARLGELMPLLVMVETIDPLEFKLADEAGKELLAEMPLVYFGANGDEALTRKVSSAGAVGPAQVWHKTCSEMLPKFPGSGIASNCNGAKGVSHSHVGNIFAGMLIALMKRGELLEILPAEVVDGEEGNRLLAASYNGGAGRVRKAFTGYGALWDQMHAGWQTRAVKVKTRKGVKKIERREWVITGLLAETVDYLPKFDYVKRKEKSEDTAVAASGGAQ